MPIAAKHSLTLALLTRAATGAACAPCFPSCFHFFPKWVPLAEKTLMISTVGCGMYMVCLSLLLPPLLLTLLRQQGEILGFSISGYLVGTSSDIRIQGFQVGGWPLPFYLFGLIGIIWTPFFLATIYSSPEEHPTITREELALIKRKDGAFILSS
jgi:MFS transporter, ACS family, solute carrier family 17 (sodium-dependent inorganic phosphate cotransporter), member 5